ncbi:MAG TPA: VWA domain-containing protein [Pyrinomonadaceae bacterium]|nr:VWA domain-containing protein [Pyrinomonadaceae bacterium]
MRKLLFICVAVVSLVPVARAQTASEILAKVSSVYAAGRTYADEGSIEIETSGTRPFPQRSYFRTAFVRPDALRFQLWLNSDRPGPNNPWVVWKNGDSIRIQGSPPHLYWSVRDENMRVEGALLRMAGFSGGSSMAVPQLLLPDAFRSIPPFSLIVDAKVTGQEQINDRPAFRIEGTLGGLPIKLWIDKTQYLVLKSYRRVAWRDREEEATIEYKPRLNTAIPPEDLKAPQSRNQNAIDTPYPKSAERTPQTAPRLTRPPRLRTFGSSLSRSEEADGNTERADDDIDVVRVETDLVVNAVLVLDGQKKVVRDLTAADFVVKEDDRMQQVATFSLGDNKDVPRSIVLIIDFSVSQFPYIRTSIESAKMLVDKLNPKDRMAIVTDDVRMLADFTSDKQLLKTQLDKLKTSAVSGLVGNSEQYDALMASLNELFDNEDERPIIIFQTDGDQLELLKGGGSPNPYSWPKYSLQDILTLAEKSRVSVYSVISGIKFVDVPPDDLARRVRIDRENRRNSAFEFYRALNVPVPKPTGPQPDLTGQAFANYVTQWQQRQLALMAVAKSTGTSPEFLEEPAQADEIYTRVLSDIDRRYVIGYYPTNRAHDGKRRKVSVEVRGHPEYTVLGQKAYFARHEK